MIGEEAGLEYIYIGNVYSDEGNHTKCPKCGEILIRRVGFEVTENKLKNNVCSKCGNKIAGVF